MKAKVEEVIELKAEIDTLKIKIKNLDDQKKAKEIFTRDKKPA